MRPGLLLDRVVCAGHGVKTVKEALDKVMVVTIRDGVYKLGTPLIIGKYRGRNLELLVRPEVIQTVAR